MKSGATVPRKPGVAVFKTTPYGERKVGPVRTYFRNEVRISGPAYRVVEVTMRGVPGDEAVLCEYVTPTEYPNLMQAVSMAVRNRNEYLKTQAEESTHAAPVVTAPEPVYLLAGGGV